MYKFVILLSQNKKLNFPSWKKTLIYQQFALFETDANPQASQKQAVAYLLTWRRDHCATVPFSTLPSIPGGPAREISRRSVVTVTTYKILMESAEKPWIVDCYFILYSFDFCMHFTWVGRLISLYPLHSVGHGVLKFRLESFFKDLWLDFSCTPTTCTAYNLSMGNHVGLPLL